MDKVEKLETQNKALEHEVAVQKKRDLAHKKLLENMLKKNEEIKKLAASDIKYIKKQLAAFNK
uniref:Uncharacterized protein n=1 Tax=viral metagenome TaxID=1070528 RepID=A0A6C0HHS7_9ZZZZ